MGKNSLMTVAAPGKERSAEFGVDALGGHFRDRPAWARAAAAVPDSISKPNSAANLTPQNPQWILVTVPLGCRSPEDPGFKVVDPTDLVDNFLVISGH